MLMSSLGLICLSLILPGCAAKQGIPGDENRDAVVSVVEVREQLDALDNAVARAADASRGLNADQNDLAKALETYSDAVDELEGAHEDAHDEWQDMQTRAEEYTTAWQEQLNEVQDESLREASMERRQEVRQQFSQITEASNDTHQAVKPYAATLKEIRQVLSLDPTPEGVAAVQPTIRESLNQAKTARQSIDKLRDALYALSGDISPPTTR